MNKNYKHPEFRERLSIIINNEQPFSWASRVGISKGAFSRLWHEGTMPGTDLLCKIQQASGCTLDWLVNGIGEAPHAISEQISNELIDIPCSQNKDTLKTDHGCCDIFSLSKKWIKEDLQAAPENLFCFHVNSPCMEPTLKINDQTLANSDVSFKTLKDGIYVIEFDGVPTVKRIQRIPGNSFKIISDNPAFENITLQEKDLGNLKLLGHVIWAGSKVA